MSEPQLTSPKTKTVKIPTKYVTITSPQGLQRTFTVYTDTDEFRVNEFLYEIRMAARPDSPNLQRPFPERVTLFKVNIFDVSVIDAENEVEVLIAPSVALG